MLILLELMVFVGALLSLAIYRVNLPSWTVITGVMLIMFSVLSHIPFLILIPIWLIYAATAVMFNVSKLRIQYLSEPLLEYVHRVLPPISKTERIALAAGDVAFDGELFAGKPQWHKVLAQPKPILSADEQAFLEGPADILCSMLDDWSIVQSGDLPPDIWQYLKAKQFFGLVIPKEYGGLGFSALGHSTIVSKIASRSFSAAVTMMVPNSLGPAELLLHYGTAQQKSYYLPRLAKGDEIPCFGLTGIDAGSDAASITDVGIVCHGQYQGKETLGIRLTWDKRYITLAPVATLVGLAFQLRDPDHLLSEHNEVGISLALIPATHPGVITGPRHKPLGLAFMNGITRGKDVFIPLDWLIGGPELAGHGWRMLMECLSVGRSLSLPALNTAGAKLCYRTTGAYAQIRKQFKLPIGHFEGLELPLSRIGGYTYMIESMRLFTTSFVDAGLKPAIISAIAKYHASEMGRQVINDAMDIQAGKAIQLGPKNVLGLLYYGLPISITVEGANLLTRNLIIFGQGAMRCHPYLQQEMAVAARDKTDQTTMEFDGLLLDHLGYSFSNAARSFIHGLTAARFVAVPPRDFTARYFQQLERMSAALAFVSDIALLVLGGALKRRENLSARLGDVLSNLYIGTAVLKYYHDNGQQKDDIAHVHWSLQTVLHNIQVAFDDFFANFSPLVGRLLRFVVFPYGRVYRKPNDKLCHQVARKMMVPSASRDRLTEHCFTGEGKQDMVGIMEAALTAYHATHDSDSRLRDAIKTGQIDKFATLSQQLQQAVAAAVMTQQEADALSTYEALRREVISVDEF